MTIDDGPLPPVPTGHPRGRSAPLTCNHRQRAVGLGGRGDRRRQAATHEPFCHPVAGRRSWYRPLTALCHRAIGDPDRLTREFAGGDGGAYLKALNDNLGIPVDVSTEGEISMTSASALRIENARPMDEEAGQ